MLKFFFDERNTCRSSSSAYENREPRMESVGVRSQLTAIARRIIGGTGAWVAPRTDLLQLTRLISALSPVATDKQLIRVGPLGDGGYLIPDDLQGIEACFSPGVSMVSGFERQCADAGMAVFLADASVDGPAESHPRFSFTKKFVGITHDDFFMTMDNWVKDSVCRERRQICCCRLTSRAMSMRFS
jgi:hypothetical protein